MTGELLQLKWLEFEEWGKEQEPQLGLSST